MPYDVMGFLSWVVLLQLIYHMYKGGVRWEILVDGTSVNGRSFLDAGLRLLMETFDVHIAMYVYLLRSVVISHYTGIQMWTVRDTKVHRPVSG